jgi:AraC family transcriptional regulator
LEKYTDFINQIPQEAMKGVERRYSSDVALFKPKTYISGVLMHSSDYHIIIPTVAPPDTYINGRLHSLEAGKFVNFNPGDSIMCAEPRPTTPYKTLLIKPELVSRIAGEMDFTGEVRFLKHQNTFSIDLLHAISMFDRETDRPDQLNLLLDCIGTQIIALMLREFKTNIRKYPASSPNIDSYVNIAIEYMREFFSANLTIEDICDEIGISPFHFIREFKRKTGFSPHQFLISIRIEKAAELLRSRQYSVMEAGRLCGFVNLSHFSRTFKQKTGKSPKDYE